MDDAVTRESSFKALGIVVGVAVVCALLVSFTAVKLRPYYIANQEAQRVAQLESILSALSGTVGDIDARDIEARVVELDNGRYSETVNPNTYDARKAVNDPAASVTIPADMDVAGIKRRAKHATVFVVRDTNDRVQVLILPVWGSGYQSALHGFLALAGDTNTVLALKFYEQGDTPGLGARIQDPDWEAQWSGKRAFDQSGVLRIGVTSGSGADVDFEVDGISGATRTSLGVDGLLRFWLGDFGFGPFLDRVRQGEA